MKIYMIEYQRHDSSMEPQFYVETLELYTREDTANKRKQDLGYEYSHRWDDDLEKVVGYPLNERIDNGDYYTFEIRELEVQDICPEQLPKIRLY